MNQALKKVEDDEPWYKQFWPWFLIILPATVVVAGIGTVLLAFHYSDSVVSDDYYRDGLAINKEVDRDRRAEALGLQADLQLHGQQLTVNLSGGADYQSAISLHFSHPLIARKDFVLPLTQIGEGLYEGQLAKPLDGRWYVELSDLQGDWRLQGELQAGRSSGVRLIAEHHDVD